MIILHCYINPKYRNMEQVLTLLDIRFIDRMTFCNMSIEVGVKVGEVRLVRAIEGVDFI